MQLKCPGCSRTLKIPDSAAGKVVKCPCGKQLRAPQPTATQRPNAASATAARPAPNAAASTPGGHAAAPAKSFGVDAELFDELTDSDWKPVTSVHQPTVASSITSGQSSSGSRTAETKTSKDQGGRGKVAKQSPASGDPARKRKIIGVVGLSLLLGIVGIFAVFYLGNGHSGWATETFKGYQIDMPAGNDRTQKSHQNPLATVYELTARRQETGSQYTILVAETPGTPADTAVEDMIRKLQILIYDEQPIRRNGVDGVSGKWSSSTMGAEASEAEVFFHNGHSSDSSERAAMPSARRLSFAHTPMR